MVYVARRSDQWEKPTWRGRLVAYLRASGLVQLPCWIDRFWWILGDVRDVEAVWMEMVQGYKLSSSRTDEYTPKREHTRCKPGLAVS